MSNWGYCQYIRQVVEGRYGKDFYTEYAEQIETHFLRVMTAEEYVCGWYPSEDDIYLYIEDLKKED